MNSYKLEGEEIDSIDLKCLVVSRGVKVARRCIRNIPTNIGSISVR